MNEIAPNDKIQWLEQRHAELIEELDDLNSRLEQALNSFTKSTEPSALAAGDHRQVSPSKTRG